MSRRTRLLVLLISTPLVAFVMVGGLLGAVLPSPQQGVAHLRVFEDVVRLILGAYVEPPNIDKVMDGAMRGLADGLDPSTSYLSPDEVRAIETRAAIPTADIGVTVTRQFYLRVAGVRDGSPAARAGLRSGDFIRAINDVPTRDMSAYAGARALAGPAGSRVSLLVIRGNAADPHTVALVREDPSNDRATSRRLPGGEAYVRVSSFKAGAAAALRGAIQATGPAASQGLILDLRDVADGSPDEGVAAARLFIAKGTLATRAARSGDPVVVTAETGDGALTMPLVVIVSRGTGSAAEVLAAALAGNKRATLVGEPTAGIAGVQRLVKLPEGHGLFMTTARYLQADGNPIHARGLRPDVPVEVPTVAFDQPAPETDVLLERAVRELKQPTPRAAAAPTTGSPTPGPGDRTRDQLPPTTPPGDQGAPRAVPPLPARPPATTP